MKRLSNVGLDILITNKVIYSGSNYTEGLETISPRKCARETRCWLMKNSLYLSKINNNYTNSEYNAAVRYDRLIIL